MTTPGKGRADYLEEGSWNAACALCGRKRKSSEMRKIPQGIPGAGLFMCQDHNYNRNPQDFVRGIPDRIAPPWTQPPAELDALYCTPNGISAVPGQMEPGCIIPGYLSPSYNPDSPI